MEIVDLNFLLAFCGITFVGAVVQGVSGFAFGVVVLMVFPYLFGYTSALAFTNLLVLLLVLYSAWLYRKHCNWQWIGLGVVVSIVADFIGIVVLAKVGDSPIWHPLMGAMFIIMALYLQWGQKKVQVRPCTASYVIFAALSGLVMGAFAVGGPIMATFYMLATKGKEEYLGTMQMFSVFTMAADVFLRIAFGMFSFNMVGYVPLALVFMVAGIFVARILVRRMDALTMRRVICVVMAIDGLVMLVR